MDIILQIFLYTLLALFLILFCILFWSPRFVLKSLQKSQSPLVHYYKEYPFQNEVFITIDDVPNGYEKQIFQKLDSHNIKATFFIIANELTYDQKKSLAQAVQNGHQLGNHGITNSIHAHKKDNELEQQILQCDSVINEIYQLAGVLRPTQKYYRPGGGMQSKKMKQLLVENGYQMVLGSVYPHDYFIPSSCLSFRFIKKKLSPGDIIIIHDIKSTPKLLDSLLPWLQQNNFQCNTLEYLQ